MCTRIGVCYIYIRRRIPLLVKSHPPPPPPPQSNPHSHTRLCLHTHTHTHVPQLRVSPRHQQGEVWVRDLRVRELGNGRVGLQMVDGHEREIVLQGQEGRARQTHLSTAVLTRQRSAALVMCAVVRESGLPISSACMPCVVAGRGRCSMDA